MELLERLGYRDDGTCFRHSSRTAVFCGDLIDRGPRIPDVVNIVRAMVEHSAAFAVMGNHEFNAIAFHTPLPDAPNAYFRPHTPQKKAQHQATLDQYSTQELNDALAWFRTLPIALNLESIRVVHACWDQINIDLLHERLAEGTRFDAAFLQDASDLDHPLGIAVDRVLKGPEASLPDDRSVTDKEGHIRRRVRIRWYESPDDHSLGSYAFPSVNRLRNVDVPADVVPSPYPKNAPPVFVGHYWLNETVPTPLCENVACLDYSIAKGGILCAYRFDGEKRLSAHRFVAVPAGYSPMASDP